MHSPSKDSEEPTSTSPPESQDAGSSSSSSTEASQTRPPAKRPFTSTVIEISDTESDDSDVCAVNSYQASADEVKRIRGSKLCIDFHTNIILQTAIRAGILKIHRKEQFLLCNALVHLFKRCVCFQPNTHHHHRHQNTAPTRRTLWKMTPY